MNDIIDDIYEWVNSQNYWLNKAVHIFVTENRRMNQSDMPNLFKEALNGENEIALEQTAFSQMFNGASSKTIILKSISDVEGINKLKPRNPLRFTNDNLFVVYGKNGSGKSGYIRLLKEICNSHNTNTLLGNVFESSIVNPSANISYEIDGQQKQHSWSQTSPLEELSTIDIYDTSVGNIYLTEDNTISYEPTPIKFFKLLSDQADIYKSYLEDKRNSLLQISDFHVGIDITKSDQYKKAFSQDYNIRSRLDYINSLAWDETGEQKIKDLEIQADVTQQKLNIQKFDQIITQIENSENSLTEILHLYSESNIESYKQSIIDSTKKKQLADQMAQVLDNQEISGIGSQTWRTLWESARQFSNTEVYSETAFPNVKENSKCVLCQQSLSDNAKSRIQTLEEFIKNDANQKYQNSLIRRQTLQSNFPTNTSLDQALLYIQSLSFDESESQEQVQLIKLNSECAELLLQFPELYKSFIENPTNDITKLLSKVLSKITEQKVKYISQRDTIQKQINIEKIALLGKEKYDLEVQKFLFHNKATIISDLDREDQIKKIKSELDKITASKRNISNKSTAIAELVLTEELKNNFQDELAKMGGSSLPKIEIQKSRASDGEPHFKIVLSEAQQNCNTEQILSEGEIRLVSLAAFLADVNFKQDKSPFIFDDPILSLDEDYEKAVADRLKEVSNERQVIVFTHRLSLLHNLIGDNENNSVEIYHEHWGAGEPSAIGIHGKKPSSMLQNLHERICRAKTTHETQGTAIYQNEALGICTDIRKTVEFVIEKILLNKVVQRYTNQMKTKDVLIPISCMTKEDCELLDSYMTKYSFDLHSQPSQTPYQASVPDEIKADIETLQAWVSTYKTKLRNAN